MVREAMNAAEDVVAVAADDAHDIGLQASFKVIRPTLLYVAPEFDVDALDALVTTGMVDAAMLEVETEYEAG